MVYFWSSSVWCKYRIIRPRCKVWTRFHTDLLLDVKGKIKDIDLLRRLVCVFQLTAMLTLRPDRQALNSSLPSHMYAL